MSLSLNHNYYTSARFDNLKIEPSNRTKRCLQNHKLLLKIKENNLFILQEGREINEIWRPVIDLTINTVFEFMIKVSDPLFQTKTNIEYLAKKDFKFCLSLNNENNSVQNYVPEMLPFSKGEFVLDNLKSPKSKKIAIRNLLQETTHSFTVSAMSSLKIPLERIGQYDLTEDEKEIKKFIWNINDNDFDGFLLIKTSSVLNQKFDLVFQTRSIKWKYVVKAKYAPLEHDLSFHEEQDLVEFEKVESQIATNECFFISKEEVPLHDRYQYNFFILHNGEKIKSNIGCPSINKIERISDSNSDLVLVSYITI